jgi:hypothetical protein
VADLDDDGNGAGGAAEKMGNQLDGLLRSRQADAREAFAG